MSGKPGLNSNNSWLLAYRCTWGCFLELGFPMSINTQARVKDRSGGSRNIWPSNTRQQWKPKHRRTRQSAREAKLRALVSHLRLRRCRQAHERRSATSSRQRQASSCRQQRAEHGHDYHTFDATLGAGLGMVGGSEMRSIWDNYIISRDSRINTRGGVHLQDPTLSNRRGWGW